jgi:hypothetical protein
MGWGLRYLNCAALGALLLLAACASYVARDPTFRLAAQQHGEAWWLRAEFEPTGSAIRGIPIAALDASWAAASELTPAAIPPDVLFPGGLDEMAENQLAFARLGDFDGDGTEDLALVGVFRNKADERGIFLLVLSKTADGRWRKAHLDANVTHPGFVALAVTARGLLAWDCMYCDSACAVLVWDAVQARYGWVDDDCTEED